jgi:hypothetical protein
VEGPHHGGEAARCTCGRWRAKQIEQGGGGNGILVAHGGCYLRVPRVIVMRFQLGAGLCKLPHE